MEASSVEMNAIVSLIELAQEPPRRQNKQEKEEDLTSKFKGVSWCMNPKLWRARCRGLDVGYFISEDEAAHAYDRALLALWHGLKMTFSANNHFNFPKLINFNQKGDESFWNLYKTGPVQHQTPKKKNEKSKIMSTNYRGVVPNAKQTRWGAYIKIYQHRNHLGSFTSPIEAAKAYDRAAREVFGPNAILNFPDDNAVPPTTILKILTGQNHKRKRDDDDQENEEEELQKNGFILSN